MSSNRSRPTEAGYAQELQGDNSSKPQGIEPVSLSRGDKLDNTDLQSVQQKLLDDVENLTAKRDRLIEDGTVQLQPEPTFFISAVSLAMTSGFTGSVTL